MDKRRLSGLLAVIVLVAVVGALMYFDSRDTAPSTRTAVAPEAAGESASGAEVKTTEIKPAGPEGAEAGSEAAAPETAGAETAATEAEGTAPGAATPPADTTTEQSAIAPPEEPAGDAAVAQAPDTASPPLPEGPSFDIVRVEPSGETVVAGQAEPGARVEVLDGQTAIASGEADATGAWAMPVEKPLAPGTHDLAVRTTSPDEKTVTLSDQRAVVSVPEAGSKDVLVVLNTPEGASRVLEVPGADAAEAATEDREIAMAAPESSPAATSPAGAAEPPQEQVEAAAAPEKTATQPEAEREVAAAAPVEAPATGDAAPADSEASANEAAGPAISEAESETAAAAEASTPSGEQPPAVAGADDGATPEAESRVAVAPQAGGQQEAAHAVAPDGTASPGAESETAAAQEDGTTGVEQTAAAPADGGAAPEAESQVAAAPEAAAPAEEESTVAAGANSVTPPEAESQTATEAGAAPPEAAESSSPETQVAVNEPEPAAPPPPPPPEPKVVVSAVEADTTGALYVAGTATTPESVRVYLDGKPLGEAKPSPSGTWLLEANRDMPAGTYKVRVDQVDEGGTVVARSEVPFEREVDVAILKPSGTAGSAAGATLAGDVPQMDTVIIKRGDNLWRIARGAWGKGIRWSTIYQANADQIRNPHWIYPGQVFVMPKGDTTWTD